MLGNDNISNKSTAEFAEIATCKNGKVNTNGAVPSVNAQIIVPYGIAFAVPNGEKTVMLPVGSTSVCIGVVQQANNLQQGEVMLYSSGGASVILKNDGRVLINGREY
ncbi:MAG: hypothetical protein UH239_02875 [Acutalibacteraceae bacterium]|nr:hypothetical protein [Acutalibacteraceae bacterium]